MTVKDNENNTATDTDDETVTVTDVLPTVDLTKIGPADHLAEPGGVFDFTLTHPQQLGRSGHDHDADGRQRLER